MKKSRISISIILTLSLVFSLAASAFGAYHHMDEQDAPKFQQAYPDLIGTKLDDCALCHQGNSFTTKMGNVITESSCQYCHSTYGYDGSGDANDTLNNYGQDYLTAGRSVNAFGIIEDNDSDNDTYSNSVEIEAGRFPGSAADNPSKKQAPHIILNLKDLEKDFPVHEQFMLLNTSRGGTAAADFYSTYTGVPVEDLLKGVGASSESTSIDVVAPDGFHFSFSYADAGNNYFINGTYPEASYFYDTQADKANGGWVDYSASGNQGRENGQIISNSEGLKLILAYKQDGAYEDVGYRDEEDKLQGDGPFRMVPPQRIPGFPDQLATAEQVYDFWQYDPDELETDHNGGNSARGVTAIKVEPLPEGTTEYDWQNSATDSGWAFLASHEIVIYGALRNGDISGVITDAVSGQPIAKALVATDRGGYSVLTDDEGTYLLSGVVTGPEDDPSKAEYTITVSASGYGSHNMDLTVLNDEETQADCSLRVGSDCPVETAARGNSSLITRVRAFRDTILAASPAGRSYIDAYYRVAPEITRAFISSSTLRRQARALLADIQPLLSGKAVTLSAAQQQAIRSITAQLEKGAGPELRAVLARIKADLKSGKVAALLP
ncbi:MAG: carboxypeptidase regulatory-like domain-containing protein [Deltaproteobacteria bacterium]|nr:carboxypeptidase regulatory-like domain-containing protein [Deltaproteobacteria bacterium]